MNKNKFLLLLLVLLLSTPFAHSAIVYTNPEPDIVNTSPFDGVFIDIDNDGVDDFEIRNFLASQTMQEVEIYFKSSNLYVLKASNGSPLACNADFEVFDGAGEWWYPSMSMAYLRNHKNKGDIFIAVMINKGDYYYYGWIRLNIVTSTELITTTIIDYAYDNENEKPITTGDVGSNSVYEPNPDFGLILAPNPAKDQLNILLDGFPGVLFGFSIINEFGIEVNCSNSLAALVTTNLTIDCSNLKSGVYFCKLETSYGIIMRKFVII